MRGLEAVPKRFEPPASELWPELQLQNGHWQGVPVPPEELACAYWDDAVSDHNPDLAELIRFAEAAARI